MAIHFSNNLTLLKNSFFAFKAKLKVNFKEFISRFKTPLGLEWKSFLIITTVIILFVVYVGSLLFGSSSLRVLYDLKDKELLLSQKVIKLKEENAQLHKSYLEYLDDQNQ
ncbi:MAG: hypothetical protein IE878_03070 [Epsilonproteobacteria bacterium]|nr:hypothetical protein [Campylobacterota bacterium]